MISAASMMAVEGELGSPRLSMAMAPDKRWPFPVPPPARALPELFRIPGNSLLHP
jgi:hypothetical protein